MKLSSTLKLRNFENGMKMMAVAPHHWYVQPILAFNISFGVGYCFIHSKGNAKTRVWDKAISSCTFFCFIRFHLGIGEPYISNMGKVTNAAIKIKLINEIRENWREKEWQGINFDMIQSLEKVEPTLSPDFRYEGSGEEYKFSADIYFMIKEKNNPFGADRKTYRIHPYCKMLIEEIDDDFNVKITSPIPLQKLR